MFTVALWNRSNEPFQPADSLRLSPNRWSAVALGGFDTAEIEVSGPRMALRDVRRWLAYRVQIYGIAGMVWEGFVSEVELRLGGAAMNLSMDRMYNAIKVIYSYTDADGAGATGTTAWLTDDDSITEYGRRELLHSSGGETTTAAAEALRSTLLNAHATAAQPVVSVAAMDGVDTATLHCQGRWHALDWRYYEDTTGYEAHEETGSQRVLLGWYLQAANIGFVGGGNNRLLDFDGRLDGLQDGDQIRVMDSVTNDAVLVVSGKASGDTATYTATTISFDPSDDILDSANGLGFLRNNEGIRVQGSTINDGYYWIGGVTGPDRVEKDSSFGDDILSEAAGDTVTITMAQSIEVTNTLDDEEPGATVQLIVYGQKIAQRFQAVTAPWAVGEVAIRIGKVGSPTDDITVQICADSAAEPSTVLATGTLLNADIPAGTGWRTVTLTTPYTLASSSTYYHVVVSRTGAPSNVNYYEVTLDDEGTYPRGGLRMWDGSLWQTRIDPGDMAFKLWGVVTTTQKISDIVTATMNRVLAADIVTATTVLTRRQRDGRSSAWQEIKSLLETGTSGGTRLIATVNERGTMTVDAEATASATDLAWQDDGRLRYPDGRYVHPGVLPVGQWVQVEAFSAEDWLADWSKFYVDRAEFDARSGKWTLEPKQAPDPFDIGTQQG